MYVVGTQKNQLDEMVLLSTQNICKKLWVRKFLQIYAENFCLSKPTTGHILHHLKLSAVFSTFTHTRSRLILEKVWLEFESSGINSSVSGVQVWYSQHSLECCWSVSWLHCGTSV